MHSVSKLSKLKLQDFFNCLHINLIVLWMPLGAVQVLMYGSNRFDCCQKFLKNSNHFDLYFIKLKLKINLTDL